jgi:hypothetical protein
MPFGNMRPGREDIYNKAGIIQVSAGMNYECIIHSLKI